MKRYVDDGRIMKIIPRLVNFVGNGWFQTQHFESRCGAKQSKAEEIYLHNEVKKLG